MYKQHLGKIKGNNRSSLGLEHSVALNENTMDLTQQVEGVQKSLPVHTD